jgi:hypothetical protein
LSRRYFAQSGSPIAGHRRCSESSQSVNRRDQTWNEVDDGADTAEGHNLASEQVHDAKPLASGLISPPEDWAADGEKAVARGSIVATGPKATWWAPGTFSERAGVGRSPFGTYAEN